MLSLFQHLIRQADRNVLILPDLLVSAWEADLRWYD